MLRQNLQWYRSNWLIDYQSSCIGLNVDDLILKDELTHT